MLCVCDGLIVGYVYIFGYNLDVNVRKYVFDKEDKMFRKNLGYYVVLKLRNVELIMCFFKFLL